MTIIAEEIPGVKLIQPKIFQDDRGYFFESFNAHKLADLGINETFVQDNQSMSNRGVLRGLHFQHPPMAQGKLVRVIKGAVQDVVVDIRKNSSTYGNHYSVELNEVNKWILWVPVGFAHGFCTLENETIFSYKCTNYYNPTKEAGIRWDDPELGIEWNLKELILSEKDKNNEAMNSFLSPF